MTRAFVLALVLAGCGSFSGPTETNDAAPSSDAAPGCTTQITFTPNPAIASPTTMVSASAQTSVAGIYHFAWSSTFQGTMTSLPALGDGTQTQLTTAVAGIYDVHVEVTGESPCGDGDVDLNVLVPGASAASYRLRVTSGSPTTPPQELPITVMGGSDYALGTLALADGATGSGEVVDGAGHPVSAYLRFLPDSADTPIETFSGSDGMFAVPLLFDHPNEVLIVPSVAGDAPTINYHWTAGALVVGAGSAITGTVLDPGGAPIKNAQIQIELGILPTTVGTTDATGAFTVAGDLAAGLIVAGTPIAIEVVPPVGMGLPRLDATSASFDLTKPVQIHYAPTLTHRDLGGVAIRRGGAPVPNGTAVDVVGTIAAAGTITTGAFATPATGTTVLAATTTGGALPPGPLLVPAAPLSAVLAAPGPSVTAIDLTTGVPAAIDSVAPQLTTGTVRDASGAALDGVQVTATGDGALALAGATAVTATTAADGSFALSLAAAGTYDLRAVDPQVRAAAGALTAVAPSATPLALAMPVTIHVAGTLDAQGMPGGIGPGASVQILCAACTGPQSLLPLGEASTQQGGNFTIAIPDPDVDPLVQRAPRFATVSPWMPSELWSRLSRW